MDFVASLFIRVKMSEYKADKLFIVAGKIGKFSN
jgi:hypothetical protein